MEQPGCVSVWERFYFFGRVDDESALESPAPEPDSQSGRFYNACPNFETHPQPLPAPDWPLACQFRISLLPLWHHSKMPP